MGHMRCNFIGMPRQRGDGLARRRAGACEELAPDARANGSRMQVACRTYLTFCFAGIGVRIFGAVSVEPVGVFAAFDASSRLTCNLMLSLR